MLSLYQGESLQCALGTQLKLNTTFHPQTDGQLERTIQTLEDMMRCCVLSWQGHWEDQLPLVEFAYNYSYQASIWMAPYKALYGSNHRSQQCWGVIGREGIVGTILGSTSHREGSKD
jgi:hypothetical protein